MTNSHCPHGVIEMEACETCWIDFARVEHHESQRRGGFLQSEQRQHRLIERVLQALNNLHEGVPT